MQTQSRRLKESTGRHNHETAAPALEKLPTASANACADSTWLLINIRYYKRPYFKLAVGSTIALTCPTQGIVYPHGSRDWHRGLDCCLYVAKIRDSVHGCTLMRDAHTAAVGDLLPVLDCDQSHRCAIQQSHQTACHGFNYQDRTRMDRRTAQFMRMQPVSPSSIVVEHPDVIAAGPTGRGPMPLLIVSQ